MDNNVVEKKPKVKRLKLTIPCKLGMCPGQVTTEGPNNAEIVIVGEQPGGQEVIQKKPFVGPSGQKLNELLELAGIKRESVLITNTCLCRPETGRKPTVQERDFCAEYAKDIINTVNPRMVVLLGSYATQAILGQKITKVRGLDLIRGGHRYYNTYHPAAVLHDPNKAEILKHDFIQLGHLLSTVRVAPKIDNKVITTEQLVAMLDNKISNKEAAPFKIAIDTEFDENQKIVGMGLSWQPLTSVYLPFEESIKAANYLGSKNISAEYHNQKEDLKVLWRNGAKGEGLYKNAHDTMVMAHLCNEEALGLKPLSNKYLKRDLHPFKEMFPEGNIAEVDVNEIGHYCGSDAEATNCLQTVLASKLKSVGSNLVYEYCDRKFVFVLAQMEYMGVKLDYDYLNEVAPVMRKSVEEEYSQLSEIISGNIDSPKQLAHYLFDVAKYHDIRKRSTDKEVLSKLGTTFTNRVLAYRKIKKQYSTYVESYLKLKAPRIHTTFNQCFVQTGRLSSSGEANLQNVPESVRGAFCADNGFTWIGTDLSQIELRLAAHISEDPVMIGLFLKGADIHMETAKTLFGPLAGNKERYLAKTLNFLCLPTRYKALTPNGWKSWNELNIGDLVLGYDQINKSNKWTTIKHIYKPKMMPMVTVKNKHNFKFTASHNHRWFGHKYVDHGSKGKSYDECIFTTDDIIKNPSYRITRASHTDISGDSPITENEASIIAWILSDGYIKWSKITGKTSQSFGKKRGVQAQIFQLKEPYVTEITELTKDYTSRIVKDKHGTTWFWLKPQKIRDLWNKANLFVLSLDAFVLSLSNKARHAFVITALKAEGSLNDDKTGFEWFFQKEGAFARAIQLGIFLEGFYPSISNIPCKKYPNNKYIGIHLSSPTITGQRLQVVENTNEEGWCLETELGSWITSDGDNMFITGNSLYGGQSYRFVSTAAGKGYILSLTEADYFLKLYYQRFRVLGEYITATQEVAVKNGFVRTPLGRLRYLPALGSPIQSEKEHGLKEVFNTQIQGGAAEIIKICSNNTIDIQNKTFALHIHDEQIIQVPKALVIGIADETKNKMENAVKLKVPLLTDTAIGNNWARMHAPLDADIDLEEDKNLV